MKYSKFTKSNQVGLCIYIDRSQKVLYLRLFKCLLGFTYYGKDTDFDNKFCIFLIRKVIILK